MKRTRARSLSRCVFCQAAVKGADLEEFNCSHVVCRSCFDEELFSMERRSSFPCPRCQENPNEEARLRHNSGIRVKELQNGCKESDESKGACPAKSNLTAAEREEADVGHEAESRVRVMVCQFCQEKVSFHGMLGHYDTCPHYLVACPNGCCVRVPRSACERHAKDADLCDALKRCEFRDFGCDFVGSQTELEVHLSRANFLGVHLDLMKQRCNSLTHELDKEKRRIAIFQELASEVSSVNFAFCWKISDWAFHVEKSVKSASDGSAVPKYCIQSPEFMTGIPGYCMQLTVYPKMATPAQEEILFIGIQVRRENHLLKWPFAENMSISVVDQNAKRQNLVAVYKPPFALVEEGKMVWGFCVKLDIFNSRSYIKDDMMIIKILLW